MALTLSKTTLKTLQHDQQIANDLAFLSPTLLNELLALSIKPNSEIYLAMFNGHALGVISFELQSSQDLTLHHLIVRPSSRRRGVGLFMLSEAINDLKACHLLSDPISLTVYLPDLESEEHSSQLAPAYPLETTKTILLELFNSLKQMNTSLNTIELTIISQ